MDGWLFSIERCGNDFVGPGSDGAMPEISFFVTPHLGLVPRLVALSHFPVPVATSPLTSRRAFSHAEIESV
jgi:hypothetical protein